MFDRKRVVNRVVILRECAAAGVCVFASEDETSGGGGERDNREENVCHSSQFGLQENNEDCRFHKCYVTQR